METVISFDLHAPFAVFKKPDINKSLYVTYNMLHRPALLGILGAIVGMEGFRENQQWPEYYQKFKTLRVGIEPLGSSNGNFPKTVITFNNSVGYASGEEGGMLQVTEQTLWLPEKRIQQEDGTEILEFPGFRCYVLLDLDNPEQKQLREYILAGRAEFLPYLGKNECAAWWDISKVQEFKVRRFSKNEDFRIDSLFIKEQAVRDERKQSKFRFSGIQANLHLYFERLPIGYDETLFQYNFADFTWTNVQFKKESTVPDLFFLTATGDTKRVVQLFNLETAITVANENAS